MDIALKDIEHIANLSRIDLTNEEKDKFSKQLTNILGYIGKLNELNTDSVEPMAYATELKNIFREDKMTPSLPRQKILDISPANIHGFIKVPKIIE